MFGFIDAVVARLVHVVGEHGVAAALVEHGGDVPMAGRHAVVGERVQVERDGLQRGVDLFGLRDRRHREHDLVVDIGIRQLARAGKVLGRGVAGHRQLLICVCVHARPEYPNITPAASAAAIMVLFITLSSLTLHGLDDVRGGDAEALEQLVGLAAARNLADGEALHREAGVGHRLGHRVADAARRVVILDRDEASAGRAPGRDERRRVDRLRPSRDR